MIRDMIRLQPFVRRCHGGRQRPLHRSRGGLFRENSSPRQPQRDGIRALGVDTLGIRPRAFRRRQESSRTREMTAFPPAERTDEVQPIAAGHFRRRVLRTIDPCRHGDFFRRIRAHAHHDGLRGVTREHFTRVRTSRACKRNAQSRCRCRAPTGNRLASRHARTSGADRRATDTIRA